MDKIEKMCIKITMRVEQRDSKIKIISLSFYKNNKKKESSITWWYILDSSPIKIFFL